MAAGTDGYDTVKMIVTVLGSGTSHGVPMIGCGCDVCRSDNPKNRRNRPCLHVLTDDGFSILVDTPPELRITAIAHGLTRVDAVLFTHSHADHIFGLDDLRMFNWLQQQEIPIYAEAEVIEDLKRAFSYIWRPTQAAGGKPQLSLNAIAPGQMLRLGGIGIEAVRVMHGSLPILAYVFDEKLAYVTDVSEIPAESWKRLEGRRTLLLDAVRRQPHPTHYHFERAVEIARALGASETYFVHLSHDFDHDVVNAELPQGMCLAYDGLRLVV